MAKTPVVEASELGARSETRKDEVLCKLKALLEPLIITNFYTDVWGANERHIKADKHTVGQQNTQKIEKNLNLPPRIKRLYRITICWSKKVFLHDMVIGLFINRYKVGLHFKAKSTR